MANTLTEIQTEVFFLLWESQTSGTYNSVSRVLPKINDVITRVCSWEYKDILRSTSANNVIYKAWDLRFLRNKMFIERKPWSPTTSAVTAGDAFVSVDTTNFSSSWYAIIWWNIFNYTSINPTALVTTTGIIGNFPEWTLVEQVYLVPADVDRSFRLVRILQWNQSREFPNMDNKFDTTASAYFSILPDTQSTENNFVYIPWVTYQNTTVFPTYWFEYYKVPNTLSSWSDTTVIPWQYWVSVIAPLVAGELLYETEEIWDAQAKLQLGYSKLQMFYSKYKDFNKQFRDKVDYNRWNQYYWARGFNWWNYQW